MKDLNIKECIDILKTDKDNKFIKMTDARRKLLDYDISEIKKGLTELELELEELLNLKYAIKLSLSNINMKPFWLILLTVIVTESAKNIIKDITGFYSLIGIVLVFLFIYFATCMISEVFYNSSTGRFQRIRKKKILIDFIDFEIEKKKEKEKIVIINN